ncbi:hypothetical protein J3E69DRAFT_348832 [Trichoderma sp. SZMC 28015]
MTATKATDSIAQIIMVAKAGISSYNIIKDDSNLGETFHKAGCGLQLIVDALHIAEGQQYTEISSQAATSLESLLAGVKLAYAVFDEVSRAPANERFQVYKDCIDKKGKGNRVETLVSDVMSNICLLAEACEIEAGMRTQLKALRDATADLDQMDSSIPVNQDEAKHSFANLGPGNQYNAAGGTQNIVSGNSKQFTKSNFHGAVTFN